MQRFIAAMDEEYPILEFLYIVFSLEDDLEVSKITSSAILTPTLAAKLCPSDSISITHDYCGASVGLVKSCRDPPIHILPSNYSAPMDFSYASLGDAQKFVLNSLFPTAPSRNAIHAYADNRTHYAL